MTARMSLLLGVFVLLTGCGPVSGVPRTETHSSAIPSGTEEVRLSVEPRDGVRPVIKEIDRARFRVFVCAYILSQHAVIRALQRAAAQSVDVYVLLEQHPFGLGAQPEGVADRLRASGIHVRWTSHRFVFTHAKYMLLDDRVAVISTANFSRAAFAGNREFLMVDRRPEDVHTISNLFRRDWNGSPSGATAPDLVVSPLGARSALANLITSARRTLDVYAEEVDDPATERELIHQRRVGRAVRVLLPAGVLSRGARALVSGGVQVRTLSQPYIHAKALLVDGVRGFAGSENLSTTSLDRNRELGILIRGWPLRAIERIFDRDWRRARLAR